uniref:(northern house mosquito) hypothetical protein n=1 Tax=Culex pipiens TaxID=7175 RepID=A0A8D8G199_CULPI
MHFSWTGNALCSRCTIRGSLRATCPPTGRCKRRNNKNSNLFKTLFVHIENSRKKASENEAQNQTSQVMLMKCTINKRFYLYSSEKISAESKTVVEKTSVSSAWRKSGLAKIKANIKTEQ